MHLGSNQGLVVLKPLCVFDALQLTSIPHKNIDDFSHYSIYIQYSRAFGDGRPEESTAAQSVPPDLNV